MKKMDEMDRNIQLRSKEWGYHTAMLALAGWSLFNSFRTLTNGTGYNPLPGLILCAAVCIQGLSQSVIKRRMIAAVAVASVGTYFIMRV